MQPDPTQLDGRGCVNSDLWTFRLAGSCYLGF